MDTPDKNGVSAREHLAGALKRARSDERRRQLASELAGPPFPRPLSYLWALFVEIADGLENGGWGPPVVTWQSLQAWSQLTGVTLDPREACILVRLGVVRAASIGGSAGETEARG